MRLVFVMCISGTNEPDCGSDTFRGCNLNVAN